MLMTLLMHQFGSHSQHHRSTDG